jgi:hypothetical protein
MTDMSTRDINDRTGRLVEIAWVDTIQDSTYETHENVECPIVRTVGYLAFQDERTIKIGNTRTTEGEISGICAIPIGCVMSVKEVKHEHPD